MPTSKRSENAGASSAYSAARSAGSYAQMFTMLVPTTIFDVASSSGRTDGRRGEPPSQNAPYPSCSTSSAAAPNCSTPIARALVQTPIFPSSIPAAYLRPMGVARSESAGDVFERDHRDEARTRAGGLARSLPDMTVDGDDGSRRRSAQLGLGEREARGRETCQCRTQTGAGLQQRAPTGPLSGAGIRGPRRSG